MASKRDPKLETDDLKDCDPKDSEPENHIKRLVPTFTPIILDDLNKKPKSTATSDKKPKEDSDLNNSSIPQVDPQTKLDYQEALYYGESKYA